MAGEREAKRRHLEDRGPQEGAAEDDGEEGEEEDRRAARH